MKINFCKQLALALTTALVSAAAQASVTWDFSGSGGSLATGSLPVPNVSRDYSSGSYGVQVTAIADTGNNVGSSSTSSSYLETASVSWYSGNGLAVMNRDGCPSVYSSGCGSANQGDTGEGTSPEHAMDNDGRYESLIFNFGTNKVQLESITVKYPDATSPDSDVSILYWTKAVAPVLTDGSKKYSDLIADGWAKMGTNGIYTNLGGAAGTTTTSLGNTGQGSSWWLIGAYNPNLTPGGDATLPDALKIAAVTACVVGGAGGYGCSGGGGKAPEPGSLALVAVAMLGMASLHRRRRRL